MKFYEVIESRNSAKRFSDTPIDKESLDRIINAAMRSPSWKDNTSYRIILVTESSIKDQLASAVKNKTDEASTSIKEAPVVAVIVGDPSESGIIDGKEYYLVDGAIAMEHLVLAATSEGYGTCWIGVWDEQKVKQALSIPDRYRIIAMTPIGKADEYKPTNPKKDVREHVFLNSFGSAFTENTNKGLLN